MTTTTINNDDNNNTKSTITLPFQGDPSLLLPDDDAELWNGAGDGFHCQEYLGPSQPPPQNDDDDDEYWDDDRPVVWFQCTIPTITTTELPETSSTSVSTKATTTTTKMVSLTFECLEPSCDVLMQDEKSSTATATGGKKDYDYDGAMDPFFFDPGYTLAGKTGFQIWPGSRLLVEALLVPLSTTTETSNTNIRLVQWQERIQNPKESDATIRILELGSGVGMVGTSLAAVAGAHVLLTDLKTLVENSTQPNLQRNSTSTSTKIPDVNSCWLTKHHMKNMVSIGKGWAATTPIDWTIPLISTDTFSSDHHQNNNIQQQQNIQNQLELEDIQNIDLILASDCIWLVSMMEPLFDIVDCIFTHNPQAKFLLSFQRRDGTNHEDNNDNDNNDDDPKTTSSSNKKMFTTVDSVLKTMMEERKWSVQCLAWRPTNTTTTTTTTTTDNQDPKEVFLFEASVDRT
eukprot:scaffold600_cov68-Cylindrotheca_fusiformis.AAC.3